MAKWNKELALEYIMAGELNDYEVARLVSVHNTTISNLRNNTKGAPRSPGKPNPTWDRGRVVALVMEGAMSNADIARATGAPYASVDSIRRRMPDAPSSPPVAPKYDRAEAIRLVKERRLFDSEIANEVGCESETVGRIRASLGLDALSKRHKSEHDEDLIRMHEQKVPLSRQARTIGESQRFVERARRRLGLKSREARAPITPERRAQAEALFDDEQSRAEVSRTTGLSEKWLRKNFPGRAWTQEQIAEHRHALDAARKAGIDL